MRHNIIKIQSGIMMEIDKKLITKLLYEAAENPRLRQNYDLRTSSDDNSQRMLNALLPGTVVPIHRHPHSTENVLLLHGKLVEVLYEEERPGDGIEQKPDKAIGRRLHETYIPASIHNEVTLAGTGTSMSR